MEYAASWLICSVLGFHVLFFPWAGTGWFNYYIYKILNLIIQWDRENKSLKLAQVTLNYGISDSVLNLARIIKCTVFLNQTQGK